MDLTAVKFNWVIRIYNLYRSDSFRRKGFHSKRDLAQRVENRINPSTTVMDVIRDLCGEGFLFEENGLLLMDRGKMVGFIEGSLFYKWLNEYEEDARSIRVT